MCFKNDDPDFQYSCVGSCFVFTYRKRLWAVTAKHVLTNNGFEPNQVHIPVELGAHEFFDLIDVRTFTDYPDDSDCTDVVLFELGTNRISDLQIVESIYDLDADRAAEVRVGQLVTVYGFPSLCNVVDYDKGMFDHQRRGVIGLLNASEHSTGCREIDLADDGGLSDHNGFSGGPVFAIPVGTSLNLPTTFIGINLRGSIRKKHFLDRFAVERLVDYHLQQTRARH